MLEQFKERYLRKSRKLTDMLPIAALISTVLFVCGQLLFSPVEDLLGLTAGGELNTSLPGFLYMAVSYFEFIGIWLTTFLAIAIPPANRRMFKDILPNSRGNNVRGIVIGQHARL